MLSIIHRTFQGATQGTTHLAIACFGAFIPTLVLASEALAAPASATGNPLVDGILLTVLYSGIGIIMTFIAYKVVDIITPGNLSEDIAKGNIALAILTGCIVLGICIIIAAAIVG